MSYYQLTPAERFQIYTLRKNPALSLREIARQMDRSHTTISRELKRNRIDERTYLPDTAQLKMEARRQAAKTPFSQVSDDCLNEIQTRLKQYHSPEQIAGRLKKEGRDFISNETIYQMLYAEHQGMKAHSKYLRQAHIQRRKRLATQERRGQIPGRVGIEHRPVIADAKTQIGHWEGDTVIGKHQSGAVATYVDKASKFLVAELMKDKTAAELNQVTISAFALIPEGKKMTFTFDNGKEFSGHQKLSRLLKVDCYFARPYDSWERGLNEHTNGLLRQFFPKRTDFNRVTNRQIQKAVEFINHRPRKSLGYATPYEVFYAESGTAALHS